MTAAAFAQGATVSGIVDLTAFADTGRVRADGLSIPSNWTNGTITFLILSSDGTTYLPLENSAGGVYTVAAVAGSYLPMDDGIFAGISNFKIQSSVAQAAAVSLSINLVRGDAPGGGGAGGAGGGGSSFGGYAPAGTQTTSATANTKTSLFAAVTARGALMIQNPPGSAGNLSIYFGASTTPFMVMAAGGFYQTSTPAETPQSVSVSGSIANLAFYANQSLPGATGS